MLPKTRMRPVDVYAPLTLLLSLGLVTTAVAQGTSQDTVEDAIRDSSVCLSSGGGSRIVTTCDGEKTTVLRSEAELTTTVKLAPPKMATCSGEIDLEYSQWGTMARVQGTLNNETCAASTGEYEITVRVRDENGEIRTLEFTEAWQRSDDQPVMFTADYPIGENVELIRLNSRWLKCTCADTTEN